MCIIGYAKVSGFQTPSEKNFLSYRMSKNECFELNIGLQIIRDALFNNNIHKFVRFTNFAKIQIKN
jgi:hypothetical protein